MAQDRTEYNRAYHEANSARISQRKRHWYKANRDKIRETQRAYTTLQQRERNSYQRADHEANREAIRERKRAYYEAKRDDFNVRAQRRRALKHDAYGEDWDAFTVADRDEWKCQLCGKEIDGALRHPHKWSLVIDHIRPLSKHGTDEYANVQAAHHHCNSVKWARLNSELDWVSPSRHGNGIHKDDRVIDLAV
jgi:5-methylcytosine-specific restriction endonuclease McrA